MALSALAMILREISEASIFLFTVGCALRYSERTMARVYGSSPEEEAADQMRSGARSA
jgi:hypothetical protein